MGAPAKVLHALALVAKEEASYGAAIALTPSADGIEMRFDQDDIAAIVNLGYLNDGDIGPSITSLGQLARVVPTGLYAEGTIPALLRLPGIAYSASVMPNLHRLLKAAGFDATGSFVASSEKWTYAPTTYGTAYTSLTANVYERGEMAAITGMLCDLEIDGKSGKPPVFTFPFKGIGALPSDASPVIPAGLAYLNTTVAPLVNQAITLTFGSFTTNAVPKSWNFKLNRSFDNSRANLQGSNIYAGVVPTMRRPTLKLVLEATALVGSPYHTSAGFDPYQLKDKATAIGSVIIQLGSTQYNRMKIQLTQSQVVNWTRQGEGPTATVELEIAGYNSTPLLNDDCQVLCD
ncbi:MAG: hypothetical protein U9Q74_03780 [Gemmatimonadota bacterium]|nr:hypothetical protein [Gemmatimonadota bacterium]